MYTLAHHRQGFAGCELVGVPQRRQDRVIQHLGNYTLIIFVPCLRVVWAIIILV